MQLRSLKNISDICGFSPKNINRFEEKIRYRLCGKHVHEFSPCEAG